MVKKIRNRIALSIKSRRLNVFLLFFLIASVVLILYKLSKVQTKTYSFKIHTIHTPKELVGLNVDSLKLDITVKATGYKLLKYYFGQPSINLEFDNLVKQGDSVYVWNKGSGLSSVNDNFELGEEIQAISPEKLTFLYDVNTVSKVPVKLNHKLGFTQGYDLVSYFELSPDSVTVIGPESVVSHIKQLQTDTLVLENVNADISKKINLFLPDSIKKLKFSTKTIEVIGKVDKFTEGTFKVPIMVKNVPENYSLSIFPKEITITFYTNLSNFNKVEAKDFKVECDYAKVTSERPYLEPVLVKKPETVKSAKVNQNRVEFILNE